MLRHQRRGSSSVLQDGSPSVEKDSTRLKETCFRIGMNFVQILIHCQRLVLILEMQYLKLLTNLILHMS